MLSNKLEIFITDEIAERINEISPWDKCDKCKAGYKSLLEFCDCTKKVVIDEILNVPERYRIDFSSKAYEKDLPELLNKKFVILQGGDFYVKLIGFDMAKRKATEGNVCGFVYTKSGMMDSTDVVYLAEADLILFNDVAKKMTDVNYRIELVKRMDKNKQTIFLHSPLFTQIEDEPDVKVYDTDSIGIKIK